MSKIDADKIGAVQFRAFVQRMGTVRGHWQIVLDVFETETAQALKGWDLYNKSVQVALVPLPEDE